MEQNINQLLCEQVVLPLEISDVSLYCILEIETSKEAKLH